MVPASAALKLNKAKVATLAGEEITVDGASGAVKIMPTIVGGPSTVVIPDLGACNGIVHVVDEVIALDALAAPEPECKSIAELAAGNDALSTLFTAVKAADPAVAKLLNNKSATLTVFAPSNDAFEAIGEEALFRVLADQALLTKLLQKHVVNSVVPASAALKLKMAKVATLSGETITVDGASGKVTVKPTIVGDAATVVIPDVNACNGVVHVVDEVIALDALAQNDACLDFGRAKDCKKKGKKQGCEWKRGICSRVSCASQKKKGKCKKIKSCTWDKKARKCSE